MKLSFNYYENNIKKVHTYEVDKSHFLDNSDRTLNNYLHIIKTLDKEYYDKELSDPVSARISFRNYIDNKTDLNFRKYSWFNKDYQPGSLVLEYIANIINFVDSVTINDFIILIETLLEYNNYMGNKLNTYFKIPIRLLKHRLDTNETKVYDMLYALTLCNKRFILPFFKMVEYSQYSDRIRLSNQALILLDRDLFFVKRSNVLKYNTTRYIAEHDSNRNIYKGDYDFRDSEDDDFSTNRKTMKSKTFYNESLSNGWYNRIVNSTIIGLTLFYNECLYDSNILYSFTKKLNRKQYYNDYQDYTRSRLELEVPVLLISECTGMNKEEIMKVVNRLCRYTNYIKMHDKIYVNCGQLLDYFKSKKTLKKEMNKIKDSNLDINSLTKYFDALGADYYDDCHNYDNDNMNIRKFMGSFDDIAELTDSKAPKKIYIKSIKSYFKIMDSFETWEEKEKASQNIYLAMSVKNVAMNDDNKITPYSIFLYKNIFEKTTLGKNVLKNKSKYIGLIKRFINNSDNISFKYEELKNKDKRMYGDIYDIEDTWDKMRKADLYLQNTFNVKNKYAFLDVPTILNSEDENLDTECANAQIAEVKKQTDSMSIENIFTNIKGNFSAVYHDIDSDLNHLLQSYKFNLDAISRDVISSMKYHLNIHNKLKEEIIKRFYKNEKLNTDKAYNNDLLDLYESILMEEGIKYNREDLYQSSSTIKKKLDNKLKDRNMLVDELLSYQEEQIRREEEEYEKVRKAKLKKKEFMLEDLLDKTDNNEEQYEDINLLEEAL